MGIDFYDRMWEDEQKEKERFGQRKNEIENELFEQKRKIEQLEKENASLSKMLNEAVVFIEQEDMQCKLCSFYLSCRDGNCTYKDETPTSDIIRAELEKRVGKEK